MLYHMKIIKYKVLIKSGGGTGPMKPSNRPLRQWC